MRWSERRGTTGDGVMAGLGTLVLAGLGGVELSACEEEWIGRLRPAGFVLGRGNLEEPCQVRRLTERLRALCGVEVLVAVVAGDGRVWGGERVVGGLPGAAGLVAGGQAKAVGLAGRRAGEMMRMLGVNFVLGPDFGVGVWGGDVQRVVDHAGQWSRWLRHRGVCVCAGPFPVAGMGARDGLPVSEAKVEEMLRADLLPFTALMPELDAVRVSHVVMAGMGGEVSAAMDGRMVGRLLRDQLGFDRQVVVADDVAVTAVRRGFGVGVAARRVIEAGCDLVICGDPADVEEVAAGMALVPRPLMVDAWERVERLGKRLCGPLPWVDGKWRELGQAAGS